MGDLLSQHGGVLLALVEYGGPGQTAPVCQKTALNDDQMRNSDTRVPNADVIGMHRMLTNLFVLFFTYRFATMDLVRVGTSYHWKLEVEGAWPPFEVLGPRR